MPNDSMSTLHLLTTLIILLPFVGFLGLWLANRRWAGIGAVGLTGAGLALVILLITQTSPTPTSLSAPWATLSGSTFQLSFRLDSLTMLMLVLVHFVALLVQVYSIAYLHNEPRLSRYFAYLQLFVGAMLGIVLAGNLIILYAFWELVGLASYLLIGFWSYKPEASRAATKAFLMNRIGDAGFLIGILLTYRFFNTTELSTLATATGSTRLPTLVGLGLFMGCVGKSAQFPLLTWLPDAMEGPTPVSALLHAATMVAAGIFLLARIHPLLSPDTLVIITCLGTVTALWGGYSALFQNDIKKVLAFSTVSQLGLMVAGMGSGNPSGALFHLLTHAFFKAGLFLSAGAVIHAVHTQDMRQMGDLRKALPTTFVVYVICTAALAGLPLFSGFLSKEAILSGAFAWAGHQSSTLAYAVPVLLLVSSGLTALYMARQLQLVFFGNYRNEHTSYSAIHEPVGLMRLPMMMLAALSVAFWFALNPFSAHDSWFFRLFPTEEVNMHGPGWLALTSIVLALLGGWIGFTKAQRWQQVPASSFWIQLSVNYGFLDQFYSWLIINPIRHLAKLPKRADALLTDFEQRHEADTQHVIEAIYHTERRIIDGLVHSVGIGTVVVAHIVHGFDRLVIDGLVNGAVWVAGQVGQLTRRVQNGRVQSYVSAAVIGLLLLLWWLL